MTQAGILVVPVNWTSDDPVGINENVWNRYRSELESGMYLALMKPDPINAVFAQAELATGTHPMRVNDWNGGNREPITTGLGHNAHYVLPIKLLYTYNESLSIPADIVSNRVDMDSLQTYGFSLISRETYDALFARADDTTTR